MPIFNSHFIETLREPHPLRPSEIVCGAVPRDLTAFLIEENGASDHAAALFDSREGRWLSYGELRQRTFEVAARSAASAKGAAFLLVENTVESIVLYLGLLKAGHAVAVMDASLGRSRLADLVRLYAPEWVVHAADADAAACGPGYVQEGSFPEAMASCRRVEPSKIAPHPDLCLLLPTSGSTGNPKYVRLSYGNLRTNVTDIVSVLRIGPADRAVTSLPVSYSYGLSVVNTHLRAGASIIVTAEGIATPRFWQTLRQQGCTTFAGVPYSYRVLKAVDLERLDVPTLVKMTQAGGKLEDDLVAHFHAICRTRNGAFFVMYGQTEASPRMTTLPSEELPRKLGSVGKPIGAGRIWIRPAEDGSDRAECGPVGEVNYQGANVMMGYAHSRADLSSGDDAKGQLATGDLGYLDPEGYLFLQGRAGRFAKIVGLRINLDDVETLSRPFCNAAAVDSQGTLVVFAPDADDAARARLARELAERLNVHAAMLRVVSIDALPLKPNGKIDYAALNALCSRSMASAPAARPAASKPAHPD